MSMFVWIAEMLKSSCLYFKSCTFYPVWEEGESRKKREREIEREEFVHKIATIMFGCLINAIVSACICRPLAVCLCNVHVCV